MKTNSYLFNLVKKYNEAIDDQQVHDHQLINRKDLPREVSYDMVEKRNLLEYTKQLRKEEIEKEFFSLNGKALEDFDSFVASFRQPA